MNNISTAREADKNDYILEVGLGNVIIISADGLSKLRGERNIFKL